MGSHAKKDGARQRTRFDGQIDLDPDRLVFIDETWASTAMARRYGRAPRGRRLRAGVPYGHWKTTTFVAGLRLNGMVAPFVLDGPINRNAFETYLKGLLPGSCYFSDDAEVLEEGLRIGRRIGCSPALLEGITEALRLAPAEMAEEDDSD